MIQPLKPWPVPSAHDDKLSELIAGGDIGGVRAYFDSVFWEGRKERPGWSHLRLALLRENRPMLRLLHTWGAKPSEVELAAFKTAARDKFPAYMKLLRAAGFRPENAWWEDATDDLLKPDKKAIADRAYQIFVAGGSIPGRDMDNWLQAEKELTDKMRAEALKAAEADENFLKDAEFDRNTANMLDKVPQDWRRLVKAFQAGGANEAVMAGGCLRDLFNERPVKDVDIFLRSRGSQKKNKKFLKEVFEAAGFQVAAQAVGYDNSYGGGGTIYEEFPEPTRSKDQPAAGSDKLLFSRDTEMESWKILAGPAKTEYNVIFVNDKLDKKLAEQTRAFEQRSLFAGGVIDSFDIGLCQIACDGDTVVSTTAYRDDVKYQRVSLLRPNMSSEDHLRRVVAKYAGWQLNAAAQKALAPKPQPSPRRSSGYSWY